MVPRTAQAVIPSVGSETPPRTLNSGDSPPGVKRDDGDHTSERIYLREIGYFERIAPEEEVRLAKRPSSLDAPLSAEPITELGELVPDEAATIPDCELVEKT